RSVLLFALRVREIDVDRPYGRRRDALVVFSAGAAPTDTYTLSLHDALPISLLEKLNTFPSLRRAIRAWLKAGVIENGALSPTERSEEHTSELQSPCNLVCRLLLEKQKNHGNAVRFRNIWLRELTPIEGKRPH